jgi:4'-phosphopantetheinyl transferase
LCAGQLHVWRGRLDRAEAQLDRDKRLLSVDELVRAGRFVRAADHDRFIAARAFVRRVLGAYAGVPPASLRFRYGPQGKPQLAGVGTGIGFNVSHSDEWVLCAVAPARHVGVDVERRRHDLTVAEIDQVLTRDEREVLAKMDGSERALAMLRLWTRKEAVVKAMGAGLSFMLDRLEVGVEGEVVHASAHPVADWRLADVSPAPGYVGTVAAEDGAWRVLRWDGPPAEVAGVDVGRRSGNGAFPFRTPRTDLRPFGTDIRG